MFRTLAAIGGIALILTALVDCFNTIVLPRRVRRIFRLTNIFYRVTWAAVTGTSRHISDGRRREEFLSIYGPMSMVLLLILWAAGLVAGFGLLHWSAHLQIDGQDASLGAALYTSASSIVTVAAVQPANAISKWLMTVEAGCGFGLFGLVVGYLPVLYQSYSGRELRISLLDARAGSPPSSGELLVRQGRNPEKLEKQLADWENWTAEVLEEHLSYPMLAYFRSQHQNQSWLGALTALVDASAVVLLCSDDDLKHQALLTFAIGRHALVDLTTIFRARPVAPAETRLSPAQLEELREQLRRSRVCLRVDGLQVNELDRLRQMYEPYAFALSLHFLAALPGWLPKDNRDDNWLRTRWGNAGNLFSVSDPFQ